MKVSLSICLVTAYLLYVPIFVWMPINVDMGVVSKTSAYIHEVLRLPILLCLSICLSHEADIEFHP